MLTNETLAQAAALLAPWAKDTNAPADNRLDVGLAADNLVAAVKALHEARWGYLTAIAGIDLGVETGELEVLYYFYHKNVGIGLRVRVPRDNASIPTICGVISSASLYERELQEMFGIEVVGTPDPDNLFLPEGWPKGVYPLRRDFSTDQLTEQKRPETEAPPPPVETEKGQPERFIIPIGPQHPALKEPGHFELTVDGEVIVGATVRLGYAHRGIEKIVEHRPWVESLYLLERTCGICSHVHAFSYCRGVEELAGVEVPPRAQAIRILLAEMERIHSHMLWFGVSAHDAGFETLFMYSWRDREIIMDLLEQVSGNRVNYSANVLGGVKFDITAAQIDHILEGMELLEERTQHYLEVATQDESFLLRTRGIGRMSKAQSELQGTVGPTARASDVARDVRVDSPYAAYRSFPVNLITETEGDLLARFIVRIRELFESIRLIREIVTHLPEGELSTRVPSKIPEGEATIYSEAPRGELFYFIKSAGGKTPYRVKVRTPTLTNWGAVLPTVTGAQLADVPMILVGIDPCFSCNDRVITINRGTEGGDPWTWEKLRRYGIEYYR